MLIQDSLRSGYVSFTVWLYTLGVNLILVDFCSCWFFFSCLVKHSWPSLGKIMYEKENVGKLDCPCFLNTSASKLVKHSNCCKLSLFNAMALKPCHLAKNVDAVISGIFLNYILYYKKDWSRD